MPVCTVGFLRKKQKPSLQQKSQRQLISLSGSTKPTVFRIPKHNRNAKILNKTSHLNAFKTLAFLFDHFSAVIKTAARTNPMGTLIVAAVRALDQSRSVHSPYVGTPLVLPCFGNSSCGYRHYQHLLKLYTEYNTN